MRDQNEIIAFLSNGDSYGFSGAAEVTRIETHCSIVFLVADRAYKLKRQVAFSSLDYTTPERREAACRAELELNVRTAPELYLGVQAICRKLDGRIAFGDGIAVDWVVVMRRFDQPDLFDHRADARRLTREGMQALAGEIAKFHQMAERVPNLGGAKGLSGFIERNRLDQQSVESILGGEAIRTLHAESCDSLALASPLLDRRQGDGKVRRCHGDLRLANICLVDERPTLFDAIEFSEEASCVDVLFDLSFLLMDLHHHGLDELANVLFNRYVDVTGDSGELAILPLMLSVRAATRAYALAASVQRQASPSEAQHHAAAARAHLAQALSLLATSEPRLIAIGGIVGSTKASLANALAATFRPEPGARVLRSESARRRLLNLPEGARPPASAYDSKTTARVYACLAEDAHQTLIAGFTTIIDANFVRSAERRSIENAASAAQVPFVGLWLGTPRDCEGAGDNGVRGWHAIRLSDGMETTLATARLLAHARPAVQRSRGLVC